MEDDKDYFKLITGKKFEDATRIPSIEETINKQFKQLRSKYPLRTVGIGQEAIFLSEEDREANIHILGAPGEGKSKFLEDQIRQDIDAGNGLCLIDPSDGGKTCYDVLRYCASKNRKKVILIDPKTLSNFGKIAALRPLDHKYQKLSLQGIFEAINILFNTKTTDTPRIKRNLSALLRVLLKTGGTLSDTIDFSEYSLKIKDHLDKLPEDDRDRLTIENLFRSRHHFETYFYSTINRLDMFWDEPLNTIFGTDKGIDFTEVISRGWIVLVNLSPGKYITEIDAQLLGVLIISQILNAAEILFQAEPAGQYKRLFYLYIDEAARFATPQIDTLLSFKRKSGVRLILAHHFFNQFDNRKVLNSINQSAQIKVMFNTPSYDDRLEMVKALGYGGDIPPLMASYANQDLPKQYAIIKKNKESPKRVRIPDVLPVNISKEQLDNYIKQLLDNDWYVTARQTTTNTRPIEPRTETHRKTGRKARLSDKGNDTSKWKAVSKNISVSEEHADPNGETGRD